MAFLSLPNVRSRHKSNPYANEMLSFNKRIFEPPVRGKRFSLKGTAGNLLYKDKESGDPGFLVGTGKKAESDLIMFKKVLLHCLC
jgi:hypothetical protein